MKKPATIKDVARNANVSIATVSFTYHYPERVAAATRERVRAAARRLSYAPNLQASLLRSKSPSPNALTRKTSIAFLQEETPSYLYQQAAKERAVALGYGFEVVKTEPTKRRGLTQQLLARGVSGVILGPTRQADAYAILDLEQFSVVQCGRYPMSRPVHMVRPSIFKGLFEVWQRMVERGYERIGAAIFCHTPEATDDFTRRAAVLGCCDRWPDRCVPPLFTTDGLDQSAFASWFEANRPDAVLDFATCAETWLISKPKSQRPGIVRFGSHPSDTRTSFYNENNDEVARAAVELCDQLIRHRERGVPKIQREIIISGKWSEGKTLPPVKRRRAN